MSPLKWLDNHSLLSADKCSHEASSWLAGPGPGPHWALAPRIIIIIVCTKKNAFITFGGSFIAFPSNFVLEVEQFTLMFISSFVAVDHNVSHSHF
jgi:hypothetical protein